MNGQQNIKLMNDTPDTNKKLGRNGYQSLHNSFPPEGEEIDTHETCSLVLIAGDFCKSVQ
jgi:hypothetical protein